MFYLYRMTINILNVGIQELLADWFITHTA